MRGRVSRWHGAILRRAIPRRGMGTVPIPLREMMMAGLRATLNHLPSTAEYLARDTPLLVRAAMPLAV